MPLRERLNEGGDKGQVRADAKQVRIQRKAPMGDTQVWELRLPSAEG